MINIRTNLPNPVIRREIPVVCRFVAVKRSKMCPIFILWYAKSDVNPFYFCRPS